MSGATLHIVQRMAPGGLEALVLDLARALSGNQHVVSLEGDLLALQGAWPRLSLISGRLSALAKPPGQSPAMIAKIMRVIRERDARTVVTHHIGPLLYGGAAARLMKVARLVHVEHDAWHYRSPRRRFLSRLAVKTLRPTLVAISGTVAEELRRCFPGTAPITVNNGVDLDRFAPGDRSAARRRLGLPVDGLVIGSAGRLEFIKGHDVVIEAFARLPGAPILAIAGTGTQERTLRGLTRTLGVTDRVRFLGHCDDMAAVYPAFDIFCLPSRSEGLPLAILEAQASGVSSVATDVGGVRSALCNVTGLVVPPDNPEAMAGALAQIRQRLPGRSPREFIAATFDWRKTVEQYTALVGT